MKDDKVYLKQICDAVEKIESFVDMVTYEEFMRDQKTQSAVIMQLTLIGELAKKISSDTKNKIALPWRDIAGFRDRAIHDYFSVDLDIVWNTIKEDIPIVKKSLTR